MLKVIFYHRDNCQPCRSAEPGWEELRQAYAGRVAFQKVEVDIRNAADFGIQGTPSFALESDGQRINLVTGADFGQLQSFIEDNLEKTNSQSETNSSGFFQGAAFFIILLLLSRNNN